jgi:hypothetical protein
MKYTSTVALLLITASTFAQFQKKDKVLGFGFNINSGRNDIATAGINTVGQKITTFNMNVSLGFASNETTVHGFSINGGTGTSKINNNFLTGNTQIQKINSIGAGYFIQKFKPLGKGFYVFAEGAVNGLYQTDKTEFNPQSTASSKAYSAGIFIYPGIAYKAGKRFLLQLRFADFVGINYYHATSESTMPIEKRTVKTFGFGSSLGIGYLNNIAIGARWIIPH